MANTPIAENHVLIVEDDPDYAALLRSILRGAGYSVAMAHTCEDALSQVRKARPDVITLDIQMPRKSGAFFYWKLKAQERFRDVPVVILTGITRDKEMERIVRSLLERPDVPHPEAYLEKPIDGPELLKTIQDVLQSSTCESC